MSPKPDIKRILFVVYELPPIGGGVANSAHHLLTQFSEWRDIEFDVVTSSLDNTFSSKQTSPNMTMHFVPIGPKPPNRYQRQSPREMFAFIFNSGRQVAKLTSLYRYNLSHYFGYPGALIGWLFARRVPYIISLRGVDVPGYNKSFNTYYYFYKPLTILIWKSASSITALSKYLAKLAHQTTKNIKINIIPNSVDVTTFKPVPEEKKYKTFTITAGGTIMGKKKGLIYLVEGFALFHQQYPNSQLLLFGEGNEYNSLHRKTVELGIDSAVTFTGRVSHTTLAKRLPKCHVFCLPSFAEGMSNAMLEAQAAGLAIVTTKVGFGLDLLERSKALGIKMYDKVSIADALTRLYNDPEYRQVLGLRARQETGKKSWADIASIYRELYISTIQKLA